MPFMKGQAPIRRTIQYLKAGKLVLKENVKIFSINYNTYGQHHTGAKEFVFWFVPQLQYQNPNVQVALFKNMTPTPFVRCYLDDGKQVLIDIEGKPKEDILEHLIKIVGKSKEALEIESIIKEKKDNPANFGVGCERPCICEIPGQIPCTGVVQLPNFMRGKYKFAKKF